MIISNSICYLLQTEPVSKFILVYAHQPPRPHPLTSAFKVCAGGLTNATKILENLWLSGEEVTGDKLSLQREGVTHVVNCSKRLTNFYPRDFSYHRVSWEDESGQVSAYASCARGCFCVSFVKKYIDNKESNVGNTY